MILKFIFVGLLLVPFAVNDLAHAAEPVEGLRHKFAKSNHHWQLVDGSSQVLSIFDAQSQVPGGRYDLSGCMFCSGDDDNCESDGVVEINLMSRPKEPVLAVTCHVGAHSQRLHILAPWRNQREPVFTKTGAYYVTFEHMPDGITIEYDTRADDGTFEQVIEDWPQ